MVDLISKWLPAKSKAEIVKAMEGKTTEEIFKLGYTRNIPYLVTLALNKGVDPSANDNAAIWYTSYLGHLEVVKLLLTDPRVDPSDYNNFAIRNASARGHTDVVKLLLADKRVDPSTNDNYAIMSASYNGHVEVVKLLLADKRVYNSLTKEDRLKYERQVSSMNESEDLISKWLPAKSKDEILNILKNKGITNPNDLFKYGLSKDNKSLIMYALDNGADPKYDNNYIINWAARFGYTDLIKKLLKEYRLNIDNNIFAISTALAYNYIDIAKLLLDKINLNNQSAYILTRDAAQNLNNVNALSFLLSNKKILKNIDDKNLKFLTSYLYDLKNKKRIVESVEEIQTLEEIQTEGFPGYIKKLKKLVNKKYNNKQYLSSEEVSDLAYIVSIFNNYPDKLKIYNIDSKYIDLAYVILYDYNMLKNNINVERKINAIKKMYKLVKENAGGGGAGFAVFGGGWGKSFGNPSSSFYGSGKGFGSSNQSGGPNIMYTYDVKPLNQTLQPKVSPITVENYIHIGSYVKGKVLGKKEHIKGKVLSIKEDADNNILYYVILDQADSIKKHIDPTSIFICDEDDFRDDYTDELSYDNFEKNTIDVKLPKDSKLVPESLSESISLFNNYMPSNLKEEIDKAMEDKTPDEILDLGFRKNVLYLVKLALDKKADPSIYNNRPIRWSAARGYLDIVKLLLTDKRVDPTADDNYAIRWAFINGHKDILKLLLKDKRVYNSLSDYNLNKFKIKANQP